MRLRVSVYMESFSILEKIISNQKAEEVAKLNVVETVNNLFGELSERERDILVRRFNLHGQGYETLENVGQQHGLTRERIRQIESSSIKKLAKLEKLQAYLENLKRVINELLEEHGGLMERQYLLNLLVQYSIDSEGARDHQREDLHKYHLDFLISKLLKNEFEEMSETDKFKNSFKLKYGGIEHLEELAEELLTHIRELKNILKTSELFELIKGLEAYKSNEEKFKKDYVLDISRILDNELYNEDHDLINNNKVVYSLLKSLKEIEQNKFGHWGHADSKEIKPKTINDKIYLVLKNHGKPLHFVEIAEKINKIGFDAKKANPATVHNELILDGKYVLIGRGIYGLKEWGYDKGTVADVIISILSTSPEPLKREEIVRQVLDRRMVKDTTITLALMNKDLFEKIGDKYQLKK